MASTTALRKAQLDRLVATGGPLETPTLILFKNNVTISETTVMADLEEATFDGYAAEAGIDFGAAFTMSGDPVKIAAPSVQFTKTAGSNANIIYGWALTNAGKTALYYAETLPSPRGISATGDGIVIQPEVTWGE